MFSWEIYQEENGKRWSWKFSNYQ